MWCILNNKVKVKVIPIANNGPPLSGCYRVNLYLQRSVTEVGVARSPHCCPLLPSLSSALKRARYPNRESAWKIPCSSMLWTHATPVVSALSTQPQCLSRQQILEIVIRRLRKCWWLTSVILQDKILAEDWWLSFSGLKSVLISIRRAKTKPPPPYRQ